MVGEWDDGGLGNFKCEGQCIESSLSKEGDQSNDYTRVQRCDDKSVSGFWSGVLIIYFILFVVSSFSLSKS